MRRNLLLALLLSLSLPAVAAAQDNAGTYDLHDLTAFGVIDPGSAFTFETLVRFDDLSEAARFLTRSWLALVVRGLEGRVAMMKGAANRIDG